MGTDTPSEVGQSPGMGIGFNAVVDPQGNAWVAITVGLGVLQQQFAVPAQNVDAFCDNVKAAGRDARRKARGLLLPGEVAIPLPQGSVNGKLAH